MTPETTTGDDVRVYAGAEAQQCLKLSRELFKARKERDLAEAECKEWAKRYDRLSKRFNLVLEYQ